MRTFRHFVLALVSGGGPSLAWLHERGAGTLPPQKKKEPDTGQALKDLASGFQDEIPLGLVRLEDEVCPGGAGARHSWPDAATLRPSLAVHFVLPRRERGIPA